MMEFYEGFLWSTGISLGLCVGLVAWVFLRTAVYRLLGIASELESNLEVNRKSLEALRERNVIGHEQVKALDLIAEVMENQT